MWSAMCNSDERKAREHKSENARARVRTRSLKKGEAESKRRSTRLRSEAATGFWYEGWSSTLFFLYIQGSIYIMWKFYNETLTTDKFYHLSKGLETCMKVQPPKLPYLAHNTCLATTWPPRYLWIAGLMLGRSDMLTWPRYFDIPTCWCPQQLFYWTIKLWQCCAVPNWGLQWVRDIGQRQKNHRKLLKIIGNHRKWPEIIGSDWERSGKVMWPRQHVAWSRDYLLTVRKCENTRLASYGAHQHQSSPSAWLDILDYTCCSCSYCAFSQGSQPFVKQQWRVLECCWREWAGVWANELSAL